MKNLRTILTYGIAALSVSVLSFTSAAQNKDNITNNYTEMKNIQSSSVPVTSPDCQHVKIPRGNFDLAANIYLPIDFTDGKTYPAIVVSHPGGGVKEQVSLRCLLLVGNT